MHKPGHIPLKESDISSSQLNQYKTRLGDPNLSKRQLMQHLNWQQDQLQIRAEFLRKKKLTEAGKSALNKSTKERGWTHKGKYKSVTGESFFPKKRGSHLPQANIKDQFRNLFGPGGKKSSKLKKVMKGGVKGGGVLVGADLLYRLTDYLGINPMANWLEPEEEKKEKKRRGGMIRGSKSRMRTSTRGTKRVSGNRGPNNRVMGSSNFNNQHD
jgi:hypothetical protein